MKCPVFQIDAFTSRLFAGNPAAVVLLEEELPDDLLLAIAAENNLSETAFVRIDEEAGGEDIFPLRWFTPTVEVDLCGHATLAAAFVLFREALAIGDVIRFATQSGTLEVHREEGLLSLDLPSRPPEPGRITDAIAGALGIAPLGVFQSRDLLALLESENDVRDLQPDFARIARLESFAVIVTAPGQNVDFVSRFFAPRAGIPEDPVTGSAHCTLTPFWAERLGKKTLRARQLSERGGELICEDRGARVRISGQAVEYLRGEIRVD